MTPDALIYHGTPLTPRDALTSVCSGRAMCVSFYRPDDAEVVEAISPAVMFRFGCILVLAGSIARRARVGRDAELDSLFRMVGTTPVPPGTLGGHAGYAGRAVPAQRQPTADLALWSEGRAGLAYGWPDRASVASLREVRPGLFGVDWAKGWFPGFSSSHDGSGYGAREHLASPAHAARNGGSVRLPVRQRGQHVARTERVAL